MESSANRSTASQSGVLVASQGSLPVELPLARLSGRVGEKQRNNGEAGQRNDGATETKGACPEWRLLSNTALDIDDETD
jgi:hypothetical protein